MMNENRMSPDIRIVQNHARNSKIVCKVWIKFVEEWTAIESDHNFTNEVIIVCELLIPRYHCYSHIDNEL